MTFPSTMPPAPYVPPLPTIVPPVSPMLMALPPNASHPVLGFSKSAMKQISFASTRILKHSDVRDEGLSARRDKFVMNLRETNNFLIKRKPFYIQNILQWLITLMSKEK